MRNCKIILLGLLCLFLLVGCAAQEPPVQEISHKIQYSPSSAKVVKVPYLDIDINDVPKEKKKKQEKKQEQNDESRIKCVGEYTTDSSVVEEVELEPEQFEYDAEAEQEYIEPEQPEYIEPEPDNGADDGEGQDGEGSLPADVSETPEETGLTYLGNWTVSFYCPCSICCGVWASGYTASGTLATEWRTVATDGLDFGTQLYIEDLGYFVVEDRGTSYGWVDVFVNSHDSALSMGLQNRNVYIVN